MAFLAAAAPILSLVGAGLGAYGQIQQGKMQNLQAQLEAVQREREARAVEAESQREAGQATRRAKLLESRARAVAAASGAGTDNTNVENILGDISAEGEYQRLAALYSGQTDADLSRYAAGALRREGRARQSAARFGAMTSFLGSTSDWAQKYG